MTTTTPMGFIMKMVACLLLLFFFSVPASDAFLLLENNRAVSLQVQSSRPTRVASHYIQASTRVHQQPKNNNNDKTARKIRTWEENFQLLLEFKEENGHCSVPQKYSPDPRLGNWASRQRQANKKAKLTEERRNKLDEIGFIWRALKTWEENYQLLLEYKDKHGDCLVSRGDRDNKGLYNWVQKQRNYYVNGTLSESRRSKLDQIGFDWDVNRPWEELYNELVEYKAEHDDCNVPSLYAPNPALGRWVYFQRSRKAVLTGEQTRKLDAIDFTWKDSRVENFDKRWNGMLNKLKEYREKYGDCLVPQRGTKHKRLGAWVKNQRRSYRIGTLSQEREKALNEIGFVWRVNGSSDRDTERVDELWLDKYEALEEFGEEHGHLNVPCGYNATLARWVVRQRAEYMQGRLREDRKMLLNEIGFEWAVQEKLQDQQWHKKFSEYVALVDECKNDLSFISQNFGILAWIKRQRLAYAGGKLKPERKALLDSIGFNFEMGESYVPD